jgi:hypothetical protein
MRGSGSGTWLGFISTFAVGGQKDRSGQKGVFSVWAEADKTAPPYKGAVFCPGPGFERRKRWLL